MNSFPATLPQDAVAREGVSIFGAGGFARDLARALAASGVTVRAFLTSDESAQAETEGVPVQRLGADVPGASLVVGVFNRESHSDYGTVAALFAEHGVRCPVAWPQHLYGGLAFILESIDRCRLVLATEPTIAGMACVASRCGLVTPRRSGHDARFRLPARHNSFDTVL